MELKNQVQYASTSYFQIKKVILLLMIGTFFNIFEIRKFQNDPFKVIIKELTL